MKQDKNQEVGKDQLDETNNNTKVETEDGTSSEEISLVQFSVSRPGNRDYPMLF